MSVSYSSVQSLSRVQLFVTPLYAAHQASLSITNSQSFLKLMSIKLKMPHNQLIFCHPLVLLPSIFPSIRVFSNESVLCIRQPNYQSFSFSISPSSEYSGLISFTIDWLNMTELNQFPFELVRLESQFQTVCWQKTFFRSLLCRT